MVTVAGVAASLLASSSRASESSFRSFKGNGWWGVVTCAVQSSREAFFVLWYPVHINELRRPASLEPLFALLPLFLLEFHHQN
jgi:hypothetical protein